MAVSSNTVWSSPHPWVAPYPGHWSQHPQRASSARISSDGWLSRNLSGYASGLAREALRRPFLRRRLRDTPSLSTISAKPHSVDYCRWTLAARRDSVGLLLRSFEKAASPTSTSTPIIQNSFGR